MRHIEINEYELINEWSLESMNQRKFNDGDDVSYKNFTVKILSYAIFLGKYKIDNPYYPAHTELPFLYVEEYDLKVIEPELPPVPDEAKKRCIHNNVYENIISKALRFWVCSDCGEETFKPFDKY